MGEVEAVTAPEEEDAGACADARTSADVRRNHPAWFGLVFKAHRLLDHSTLGLRVIKKQKWADARTSADVRRNNPAWFERMDHRPGMAQVPRLLACCRAEIDFWRVARQESTFGVFPGHFVLPGWRTGAWVRGGLPAGALLARSGTAGCTSPVCVLQSRLWKCEAVPRRARI